MAAAGNVAGAVGSETMGAAGDVADAAAAAVGEGHDAVRELWESGALQSAASDALAWSDGLDETYTKSRAAAAAAMLAVSGIATSTFDWMKFDVVRDAYQVREQGGGYPAPWAPLSLPGPPRSRRRPGPAGLRRCCRWC